MEHARTSGTQGPASVVVSGVGGTSKEIVQINNNLKNANKPIAQREGKSGCMHGWYGTERPRKRCSLKAIQIVKEGSV